MNRFDEGKKDAVGLRRTRTAYSLILLSVVAFLRTSSLAPTMLPIFPRPEIDFSKLANQYVYGELPALFAILTASRAPVMRFSDSGIRYVKNVKSSATSFLAGRRGELNDDAICATKRL